MKIIQISSVHPSSDTRIFHKECVSIRSFSHEVVLIIPHCCDENIKDVRIRPITKPGNILIRFIRSIFIVTKLALKENGDIYHFHDPELIYLGLILKAKGKKVIYDVHEDVPRQILIKEYIPQIFRIIISTVAESMENLISQYFDAIVTATPHINNRFLKQGCRAVNINNYPILNELYTFEADWEKKERAVCYVGTIFKERGLFEMLEAIAQTDVSLLLAGKFLYSHHRQQSIMMSGWNNIKELGQLDRKNVACTLAKSMAGLVVLHPTVTYLDALPVKMFEYMSAGIPVIASNFPLWKEIIEGNQCGICVDPMNPKAIAQAIEWIVDNPNEAKCMGANGRKAVEEKYNWENDADKLRVLYKELLL